MGNPRTNCKDCKQLMKKYGENKLSICPRCEHFFNIEKEDVCPCMAEMEAIK